MTAVVAVALAISLPATAAPSGTRIEAVFSLDRCANPQCDPGRDPQIAPGAAVRRTIQVQVRSSSAVLGLDWVRLEAQVAGDPRWTCLEQWDAAGATSFARHIDWSTLRWYFPQPDWGCPETTRHYHGEPTANKAFKLRVKARERVNSEEDISDVFPITLANLPARPAWAGAPTSTTDSEGRPTVTLQWTPNREPDMIEYHFARSGPAGKAEFVVDAARPGAQGCRKIERFTFICEDSAFPVTGFAGTYRYAVFARRPAPSGRPCSLKPQPCVESQASEIRAVSVHGGGASSVPPSATQPGAVKATTAPAPQAPAPVAVTPDESRDRLAAPAPARTTRSLVLPIVIAFLVAAGGTSAATHLVRLRRRDL